MGTLAILQLADVIGGCRLYLSIYLSIYIYIYLYSGVEALYFFIILLFSIYSTGRACRHCFGCRSTIGRRAIWSQHQKRPPFPRPCRWDSSSSVRVYFADDRNIYDYDVQRISYAAVVEGATFLQHQPPQPKQHLCQTVCLRQKQQQQ